MTRQVLLLGGAGALALAILSVAAGDGRSAAEEKIIVPKDIQETVNKMADMIGKGKNGKDLDAEITGHMKKHKDDLKQTMWVFKPRMANGEGGFGYGPKPGQFTPDGLEGQIITHGNPRKPALTAMELKTQTDDLLRLVNVTEAVADLTYKYAPEKKEADKDPKDWKKYTDDMKKYSGELRTAVKAQKPAEVKMAFTKLYSSCTQCHAKFRD